jgi:hypothetical protein
MTTSIEVDQLEGIDLDSGLPCQAVGVLRLLGWVAHRSLCRRPATHRVRLTCSVHGLKVVFVCTRHARFAEKNWLRCFACGGRRVFEFGGHT